MSVKFFKCAYLPFRTILTFRLEHKARIQTLWYVKETHLEQSGSQRLKVRGWAKVNQANANLKKSRICDLSISNRYSYQKAIK